MIVPFVIFAVVIITVLLATLFYVYPGAEKVSTVPGLDPSNERDGNLPDITKAGSLPAFLEDMHQEFGPIASFWMGRQYVVSVASPDLFKEQSHVFDRPVSLFNFIEPLIGPLSIQFANSSEGQERRKLHDKSFSHDKVIKAIPLFQQVVEELVAKWTTLTGEQHVPLGLHMYGISLKTITRFSFGDWFKDEKQLIQFRKNYDFCFDTMDNALSGEAVIPGSETEKNFQKSLKALKDIAYAIVEQRKASEIAPEDKLFIDTLMDKYDNEDMLFSDVITYLIGGTHTTATLLTWCFYFLCTHPEVEVKLYKEIKANYKGGAITWDGLKNFVYLEQVINETLRCSKLAPWAARFQTFDVALGGHKIPKDTPVIHALGVMMHDEKYFPDPQRFDPERFSDKNTLAPYTFEPFGYAGKRKCPGYRLSNIEASVCLVILLSKFKVTLVPGQVVTSKAGLVTKPAEEIWVTLETRPSK